MFPHAGCIIWVFAWKIPADEQRADEEEEEKEKHESLRLVVMTYKSSTTPCEQRHHVSHGGYRGYSVAPQIKSSRSPSGKRQGESKKWRKRRERDVSWCTDQFIWGVQVGYTFGTEVPAIKTLLTKLGLQSVLCWRDHTQDRVLL